MRPPAAALLAALLWSNEAHGDDVLFELMERVEEMERETSRIDHEIDTAVQRLDSAELRADRAVDGLAEAAEAYQSSQLDFEAAAESWRLSSERWLDASLQYERAATWERRRQIALFAVATISLGAHFCRTQMSTAAYRASLGITDPDIHVDHRWPDSLGGANHPSNYQQWPAARNMACGNGCLLEKLKLDPGGMVLGMAVSVISLACP